MIGYDRELTRGEDHALNGAYHHDPDPDGDWLCEGCDTPVGDDPFWTNGMGDVRCETCWDREVAW